MHGVTMKFEVHSFRVPEQTFERLTPIKKKLYSPFGMPHGPLVLELSKKSRSYFLAGGYVKATWATVKSHDARNTKNSVRKLYAIS